MTTPTPIPLNYAFESLTRDLEEADAHLRARKEWKAAEAWRRDMSERLDDVAADPEAAEDVVREADAHRDMLALARTETEQRVAAEERTRQTRLAEDETLLSGMEKELKVYIALIVTTFLLPPALFAPFKTWCALGALPAIFGAAHMSSVTSGVKGRAWLILQDRVEQVMSRIRFAHAIAGASMVVTLLWIGFAIVVQRAA